VSGSEGKIHCHPKGSYREKKEHFFFKKEKSLFYKGKETRREDRELTQQ